MRYVFSSLTFHWADEIALAQANMYSFVESDDRVAIVLKYIEEAVKELDEMDALVQSYKIHLNVSEIFCEITSYRPFLLQSVAEDISYIQGQNKGLQVQTQNQKALLKELENLLVRDEQPSKLALYLTSNFSKPLTSTKILWSLSHENRSTRLLVSSALKKPRQNYTRLY